MVNMEIIMFLAERRSLATDESSRRNGKKCGYFCETYRSGKRLEEVESDLLDKEKAFRNLQLFIQLLPA